MGLLRGYEVGFDTKMDFDFVCSKPAATPWREMGGFFNSGNPSKPQENARATCSCPAGIAS